MPVELHERVGLLTPRRRERVAMSITDHPESASPPQASADRRANPAGGRALSRALALWAAVLALPLAALGLLLLAEPDLDMRWVSHQSHFWLVLGVAAVNVALGLVASEVATRRDDARTFLSRWPC